MIAAIWSIFEVYLREIFKYKLEVLQKRNFWKRTSIGRFMALYESVLDLERASTSLYDELLEVSGDNGVLAKTVIRDRLQRVSKTSKQFVESSRAVNILLSIYDDPLSIHITGLRHSKGPLWRHFDVWLDALPTNADHQGQLTTVVEFSKVIPTNQLAESLEITLDFPSHDHDELDGDVEQVKKAVMLKLDKVRFDLLNKAEIVAQLSPLKCAIQEISIARKELAIFIKNSFPIDKIMD